MYHPLRRTIMRYVLGLFLFVISAFIGLKLPDFDQSFYWRPLIVHRSLLTHSALLPLILFFTLKGHVLGKKADPLVRLPLLGFLLATAVHLCFDLFPYAWAGYALVHIPLFGWVGAWPSAFWLGSGALVSLYLACRLFQRITDVWLTALGLATCYGWAAAHAPYFSFAALMALVAVSLIAFFLPRPPPDPSNPAEALTRWKRL